MGFVSLLVTFVGLVLIAVGLVLGAIDGMPMGGMIGLLLGIALIVLAFLLKEDHPALASASTAAKPAP